MNPPPSPDLRSWLESLSLGQYADALKAHDITFETLSELTLGDLKECGVVSMGHRKTLLAAIQALKAGEAAGVPAPESVPAQGLVEASVALPPVILELPKFITEAAEEVPAAAIVDSHVGPPSPTVSVLPPAPAEEKSEKPPLLKRFAAAYRKASGGSLLLSIAVHAVILIIGTYLVVSQIVEERKISFGGGEAGPKNEAQHKVKRKTTTTAPAPTKRITTTSSLAKVALPDMPDIPNNMGPSIAGAMGSGGFGASGGLGGGGGGGGGSGGGRGNGFSKITFFGLNTGGKNDGFTGTFYDLKQSQGGRDTGMTPAKWSEVVYEFTKNWNTTHLSKFFKGPEQLALTQLYIPMMPADEGPKAFELEKKVQPKMWLVHYKGDLIAPKSGRFRFVGHGDDTVIVRFNGKIVLSYGQPDAGRLSDWQPTEKPYMYRGSSRHGFMPGNWVDVTAGQAYPVEILIGERPGGALSFYLLEEDQGTSYQKEGDIPVLPLFRIGGGQLPKEPHKVPFAKTGPIWKVKAPSNSMLRGL